MDKNTVSNESFIFDFWAYRIIMWGRTNSRGFLANENRRWKHLIFFCRTWIASLSDDRKKSKKINTKIDFLIEFLVKWVIFVAMRRILTRLAVERRFIIGRHQHFLPTARANDSRPLKNSHVLPNINCWKKSIFKNKL